MLISKGINTLCAGRGRTWQVLALASEERADSNKVFGLTVMLCARGNRHASYETNQFGRCVYNLEADDSPNAMPNCS